MSTNYRHYNGKQKCHHLADFFINSYKADFIHEILRKKDQKLAVSFNFTFLFKNDFPSQNISKFGDFAIRYNTTFKKVLWRLYVIFCTNVHVFVMIFFQSVTIIYMLFKLIKKERTSNDKY